MKPIDRAAPLCDLDRELQRRADARATGTFLGAGAAGFGVGLGSAYLTHNPLFLLWGAAALVMLGFASTRAPAIALDQRRIAYARALLAGLELAPEARVALRVAFDPTEGKRHVVPRHPDRHRHDWLTLEARFESGVELVLERAEELRIVTTPTERGGVERRFTALAEERVRLRLPEPADETAYRTGHPLVFPPSFSLPAPRGTEWTHESVGPRELALTFRDERAWDVGAAPEGGVDAAETTLRLLRRIAKGADLPPLARPRPE